MHSVNLLVGKDLCSHDNSFPSQGKALKCIGQGVSSTQLASKEMMVLVSYRNEATIFLTL